MIKRLLDRRGFLRLLLSAGASSAVTHFKGIANAGKEDESSENRLYLPLIMGSGNDSLTGKVIHIHAPTATNYNFNPEYYYGKTQAPGAMGVDQDVIDQMFDRGVTELVGVPLTSVSEAWSRLIPDYSAGKRIAVKVNFNNSGRDGCHSSTTKIDAIAQPINSVVRALKQIGVRDQDIIVYDAGKSFTQRVYDELTNQNIEIYDYPGCFGNRATWNNDDPNAIVDFSPPSGAIPSQRICDLLIEADYLINMPILKGHSDAGVTFSFKNHLGSIRNPWDLHEYIYMQHPVIEVYNALIELNSNSHIRNKTRIVIGDGIYGSWPHQLNPPQPWSTFGNHSPCSLFFATDPVAIDCVMHDILKAERGAMQPSNSNRYLELAADAGFGVFESGDPWQLPYGSGYEKIAYRRIELPSIPEPAIPESPSRTDPTRLPGRWRMPKRRSSNL